MGPTINALFTICFGVFSFAQASTAMRDFTPIERELLLEEGFKTFLDLYDEKIDFKIIKRSQNFLDSLWHEQLRPAHCPLNRDHSQNFLEKLIQIRQGLENSHCQDNKSSFLQSFGTSVSKLGQTYAMGPNPANGITINQDQAYYKNLNEMIGSLSSLAEDAQCAFDIKERGLIPVLSDVIGSASAAAMLVQNNYAFAAGLSGVAVSSSLEIISGLLQPDFDMNDQNDRGNFIRLACTFYELRNDLEKNNFFHIPTFNDTDHYETTQAFLASLESKIKTLEQEKFFANEIISHKQKIYVREFLGNKKLEFIEALPKLLESISYAQSEERESAMTSLSFRIELQSSLESIRSYLSQIEIDPKLFRLFTDLDQDLSFFLNFDCIENIGLLIKKSDKEVSQLILSRLEKISAIIHWEEERYQEQFLLENFSEGLTYEQLLEQINETFESKLNELKGAQIKIHEREKILEKVLAKQNFSESDDGTHFDHIILKGMKEIQERFYGHDGWHLHEYIRDNSAKELRKVYKSYNRFYAKYLRNQINYGQKIKSESVRRKACATAKDIILSINNSRSLVNMGTDYILTNYDFFHENIGTIDFHFKIIPTGRSMEVQFLHQAHSMINAKHLIEQENHLPFPKVLQEKSILDVPKLGELMIGQSLAEKKIEGLYDFIETNTCHL